MLGDLSKKQHYIFLFLGLTLLGAFCFVPAEILQIDGKNKRYRVAIKIFYKWFGQWKPLPHTKYLSIVSISKTIHLSSATSNDLHKVHACQLRLFHSAGKYLEIDEFTYKESAIEIAHPLASILDLEILDATVKPSYFIAKKV